MFDIMLGCVEICHIESEIVFSITTELPRSGPHSIGRPNPLVGLARPISIAAELKNFSWNYIATTRDTMGRSERGGELKDEIVQEIANELRLIREELQNLTMAVRSNTSSHSENSNSEQSRKFYPRRALNQTDSVRPQRGQKPQRSPQSGEPRSQWHQNDPKSRN